MASGIVRVQQWQRMIVFCLGEFKFIVGPGFHFLMPFLYKGRIFSLRKQDLKLIPMHADAYANRTVATPFWAEMN